MTTKTPPTGQVPVWDLPTRLFHWLLAALVIFLWVSGEFDRLGPHMAVGKLVAALLLFRLAWGLVGSNTARFSQFIKGPRSVLAYLAATRRGEGWPGIGHNPMGGYSVALMLALLILQVVTGLFSSDDIDTEGPLAWAASAKTVKLLTKLHHLDGKLILAAVALHLGAIAFYRFKKGENLVRPMITGTKAGDGPAPRMASPWLALAMFAAALALVLGGLAVWGK
jgi:cytochrome b